MLNRFVTFLLLALVILAALIIWPFFIGPKKLESYCNDIQAGEQLKALQLKAASAGIDLETHIGSHIIAHYPGTMGRFQCLIELSDEEILKATYQNN